MLNTKSISRIYLISGVICWGIFTFLSKDTALQREIQLPSEIENPLLDSIFLSLFFLFIFQYYRIKTELLKGFNFNDLIWQGFISSALMFVAHMLTTQAIYPRNTPGFTNSAVFIDFVNNLNIIFITVFSAKTFYVFKRMILYQKSKNLALFWKVYEYFIYLSLILNLFNIHLKDPVILAVITSYSIIGLILSLNMKWVAYLNFKQKWRNLLLIFLILAMAATFIYYMYDKSNKYGDISLEKHFIVNDLTQKIFIILVFIFILFYCISSMLVILFNFPTSSVFEQKLGEVFNFQKLSQSIQMTEKEEQIYDVLLETCFSTVMADAAWLEIVDNKENYSAFINEQIEKYDIFEIKKLIKRNKYDLKSTVLHFPDVRKLKQSESINSLQARSVLVVPLLFQNKYLGQLGLIKNIPDGFEKELIDIISSFVSQASVSIENSRLMSEALEHERYKEEIKIAKNVQQRLLPNSLDYSSYFQISAFSKAADEVGGDYYDTFTISRTKTAIVIADVSGHGTSAAFNMAQLKGVFQGLIQLDLPVDEILISANNALSRCLEKKTFITLSLYVIDSEAKSISVARAGHCPTLFYSNRKKELKEFNSKGLGLGILRSNEFSNYIEILEEKFEPNDIMLLYTDGIVEAKNSQAEEYGYERLRETFGQNTKHDPNLIIRNIISNLYDFCGHQKLDDDYTCLAIKFI